MTPEELARVSVYVPPMEDHAYVAFDDDGRPVAIVADDPKYRNDTANTVADMIREGHAVHRMHWREGVDLINSVHGKTE